MITANFPEALASMSIRSELTRSLQDAFARLQFTRRGVRAGLTRGALAPHLPPPLAPREVALGS